MMAAAKENCIRLTIYLSFFNLEKESKCKKAQSHFFLFSNQENQFKSHDCDIRTNHVHILKL